MSKNENVIYYNSDYLNVRSGGISAWQGSRAVSEDVYLLCGTTNPTPQTGEGLIYSGNLSFTNGSIYYLNVPNALYTSVYGPNYNSETGIFNFVGSYVDQTTNTKGFIYTGRLDELALANPKNYSYPKINNEYNIVFVHSVSNGFCVGNAGNTNSDDTLAFLYDIKDLSKPIPVEFPDSGTTTVYGIWFNSTSNTYTIVGGYSPLKIPINKIYFGGLPVPFGQAFVVDYDPSKKIFINWTSLNLPLGREILSHIEGISGLFGVDGVYTLSIDTINNSRNFGYYAVIIRDPEYNFVVSKFTEIKFASNGLSTINSVANNNAVGLYISSTGNKAFQAKILG